jgi:RHH-type proline utilization regulon transcriptional repressor/proline dehydrogenase/delta 1-pyrroline-5-carboxylate dehydrogenase
MGVHTRIDETMERVARRARIGNVYVNRNQIGAVVGVQPFGGEGLSGTGPKAGGPHYLPALVKRRHPDNDDKVTLAINGPSAIEKAALNNATRDYHRWSMTDRGKILRAAAKELPEHSIAVEYGAALYDNTFAKNMELPGPTGESNTIKMRGRGPVVCITSDKHALPEHITIALAAGNCVVAYGEGAKPLETALRTAGAPEGALQVIDSATEHTGMLLDNRVRAVAYDGGAEGRAVIEAVIAERKGPIIPLLSSLDEPWRFAVERTLTINTTAAGGDVRLLSLSE